MDINDFDGIVAPLKGEDITPDQQAMVDSIAKTTGSETIVFADPETGEVKATYKASAGVVEAKTYTHRDHRRKARALIQGKKGMTRTEQIATMEDAIKHLQASVDLLKAEQE